LDLKVSQRVTHQIVTRIFAIFLKEVYRYDKIFLDDSFDRSPFHNGSDENMAIYAQLHDLSAFHDGVENPAVNLEVLIPASYHSSYPSGVIQGGSLTRDLFRYGLFVMKSTASKKYSYEDFVKDIKGNYENFKDFKINQNEIQRFVEPYMDTSGGYPGLYVPQQCNSDSEPCANVFTSYYTDTKFFIDHIDKFKLKMKIYFLGDQLTKVINKFNDRNGKIMKTGLKQPLLRFLVLHWIPSEIINNPEMQFEAVEMPKCELYLTETLTCRYEVIPVSTFMNSEAKKSEGLSYLMTRVNFLSMKPIIDIYHKFWPRIEKLQLNREVQKVKDDQSDNETLEDIYNEIACNWLQENPKIYSMNQRDTWIGTLSKDVDVYIGGL
jgi:hypothetical protein